MRPAPASGSTIRRTADGPSPAAVGLRRITIEFTSDGLTGHNPPVGVVISDDNDEFTWNQGDGTGKGAWRWNDCCGDGGVLGPMPRQDWKLYMKVTRREKKFDKIIFASQDDVADDIEMLPPGGFTPEIDELQEQTEGTHTWHFKLSAFTTSDFCTSLNDSPCACETNAECAHMPLSPPRPAPRGCCCAARASSRCSHIIVL